MANQKTIFDFDFIFKVLKKSYDNNITPAVTLISYLEKNPFHVLFSTLLSLRTKDQVTLESSKRLFARANNVDELLELPEEEIAKIIYPAGFYKTKAMRIKQIAKILKEKYQGGVPDTLEELVALPGVGRKTANLVLALGFEKNAICVDTHVHRISNRLGWVKTKNPDQTEVALQELIPLKYWQVINDCLVSYGQIMCKPISPLCSKCELNKICQRNGVERSR
jgi:endonuclease-3